MIARAPSFLPLGNEVSRLFGSFPFEDTEAIWLLNDSDDADDCDAEEEEEEAEEEEEEEEEEDEEDTKEEGVASALDDEDDELFEDKISMTAIV